MSALDPANTTPNDLISAALDMAGVIGVGQTPGADDINAGWQLLQWMLQEWERKRWLVFCLTTVSVISTGALSYTLGPGGVLDTGAASMRPDKIESAFIRQLTQSQPNQIDFPPLRILQAKEDYNAIALKSLTSLPTAIFYDAQWPLGVVYPWPRPQATIYGLYVTVKTALPFKFANLATVFNIPYEYYNCIVMNLAIRLQARYSIPSFPGDTLPGLAKDALNVLRGANTAVATLRMPAGLQGRGNGYNIFSDQG